MKLWDWSVSRSCQGFPEISRTHMKLVIIKIVCPEECATGCIFSPTEESKYSSKNQQATITIFSPKSQPYYVWPGFLLEAWVQRRVLVLEIKSPFCLPLPQTTVSAIMGNALLRWRRNSNKSGVKVCAGCGSCSSTRSASWQWHPRRLMYVSAWEGTSTLSPDSVYLFIVGFFCEKRFRLWMGEYVQFARRGTESSCW